MSYSLRYLLLLFVLLYVVQDSGAQQDDYYVVARISIVGNNKTKESIIRRELTIHSGDTIPKSDFHSRLNRSKSNLVNTLLFNYVEVIAAPIDSTFTDVVINLKERFYLWPIPVFQFADPNFNTWWIRKDFSRTNYGLVVLKKNFRGRNEDLGAKVQLGYSKEFAFTYRVPYITKKQNIGAGIWASYVQKNEVTLGTSGNKRRFYTGTTGNSWDEFSLRFNSTIRRRLYNTHYFELRINKTDILDTVIKMAPDYFAHGATQMHYNSFYYTFKFDHRDNKGYPLEGTLSQLDIVKIGLGVFEKNAPNVIYFVFTHNDFYKLSKNLFFATQLKGKYTPTKDLPYFFQEGLGYSNFVRGYEYYVIDGQHFVLFKSNLKYRLYGPKVHDVKILENTNWAKVHYGFYFNFYLDAGYVIDHKYAAVNPLSNNLLYGTGIGLDFVTQYDKVIRFEYSLNKSLQHGFYLHFVKPI